MICKICNQRFEKLGHHASRKHKIKPEDYYKIFCNKNIGVCETSGCNKETHFISIEKGYNKHCSNKCTQFDYSVRSKMKQTCLTKYGVVNTNQIDDVKKRIKESNKRTYLLEFKKIMEKAKQTWLKTIGVTHPSKTEEFRRNSKNRMLEGLATKARSKNRRPSKPQIKVYNLVKEIYLESEIEYWLENLNYFLDVAIPSLKVDIEYDGSYYHQDKEKDSIRQIKLERDGWKVLRYKDRIPSLQELRNDIERISNV